MHPYDQLKERLAGFVSDRDWAQFHSPKNLAICLSVEAGELLEHYTWTRSGEHRGPPGTDEPRQDVVAAEAADVLLCLLNFCAVTGIDLLTATDEKLTRLAEKYPVERAKGSALKGQAET